MKAHEFDKVIQKFGFETRDTGDRHAWLKVDGKLAVRTMRSFGSGDLPCSDQIRQQLKLNVEQLRPAIRCHLTREAYIALLRQKGII